MSLINNLLDLTHAIKSGKNRPTAVLLCVVLLLSGCAGGAGVKSVPPPDGYRGYYPECHAYCADAYKNSASAMPTMLEFLEIIFVGTFATPVTGAILAEQRTESAAFRSLRSDVAAARKCYDEKWRVVIAQYDSGQMSKEEAGKRLREIQAGLDQVKTLIAGYKKAFVKQSEQATQASQGDLSLRAAQDEHRKAVDLYVRATKTADIEEKKKLLVESKEILKNILAKYHPSAEVASGVASNIEQVEKEIRSLDSNLPRYADQQQGRRDFGATMPESVQESPSQTPKQQEPQSQVLQTAPQEESKDSDVTMQESVAKSSSPSPAQQAKVNIKKQKKRARQAEQQPQPTATAQSQKSSDSRKEQEPPREHQEADVKPVEEKTKRLNSLDDLYHADANNEIRRQKETRERGLEF